MRAGPPKVIEAVVAVLVPPASREHVLGDLQERYTDPWHYFADAMSAVPGAIAGRVIRTVDWHVLAMQAGALYFSFLAAAWSALGPAYLYQHGDFLRLLLPVGLVVAGLALADAYGRRRRCAPPVGAMLGVGAAIALSLAKLALPASILLSGGVLGVVLICSLRMWFPPSGNRPRGEVL
jgi:hypothetical protein